MNKATSADTHDYSKAEELSRLFTLSDVVLHNGARKIASDPLTCELNAQAWAYGLALVPCQALLDNDTALIVECTLTVERGRVMVGGLHKNLAEYITPEFEVLEDRLAETTISIPISSPQQFGQVMVRTGSCCSAPPRVKLHSIKAFVAVPVQRPHLQEVDCPNIPNILQDMIVSTESCKRVESQHRKVNKVTSVDVYDYSKVEELSQLFSVSDVVMYNGAKKVADDPLTIELTAQPFAYGLALLPRLELLDSDDALVVECTLTVERGKVMVGGLHKNLAEYIAPEIEISEDSQPETTISISIASLRHLGQIMVRTGSGCSAPPRVKLHSIKAFVAVPVQRPHLQEVDCPSIPNILHDMIVCAGSFQVGATYDRTLDGVRIALTTCSRRFEPERCLQDYLKKRFSRPDRLTNLPPFYELPPRMEYPPYYGPLSILELRQTKAWLEIVPIQCFDTPDTISHACVVGGRLVLCFQNFIYVMESLETAMDGVFFREDDPNLITDDWFLDLHTIFVVDDRTCIVSSSGADAVLWVDIPQRKVIQRWRLPAEIYGVNYDLAPGMSLHEHRISNDLQLGHLNCAYPDGNGGCIISTLGQGDVGQVDASGNYKVLASGYVGCHGARYALDRSYIYFVSSCTGQLLRIGERGQIEEMIAVHSKWLQDVEQIKDDIFAFSLADRNEMSIIDVARKVELGRFGFDARGNTTVFVHVLPPRQ